MTRQPLEMALLNSGVLARGDSVLAAVSGGADSMAMLTALHRLAASAGLTVAIGHFDHGLHQESRAHASLVERYALELNLRFHPGSGDTRTRARSEGQSLEEAARDLRYSFLEDAARRAGANVIATAHTSDDQAETVLMRVLRGTGVRGLGGIPRRRGNIVRPLLDVTHAQAQSYCRHMKVEYVEDPTNRDNRFTRNRIRNEVLPQLRSHYPDVDGSLIRLAASAAGVMRSVRSSTDPIIDRYLVREEDGVWAIDAAPLAALDDVALHCLLADIIAYHMRSPSGPGQEQFEKLMQLCRSQSSSGKSLSLPGITARREHDQLLLVPDNSVEQITQNAVQLSVPGETLIGTNHFSVDTITTDEALRELEENKSGGTDSSIVAYFDRESLRPPLRVRAPEAGDRMRPFGMRGQKKLSDIFIDRKVPVRRRTSSLVVEDQSEIIWVVGVMAGETGRVSGKSSQVIRISVEQTV